MASIITITYFPFMISCFRCKVDEICTLLGYYAMYSGQLLLYAV